MPYSSLNEKRNLTHTYESQGFLAVVGIDGGTGKKKLILNSEIYFNHCIQKFKEGERVTLQVTNKKPKRTEQQNRYLWGVFYPQIAKETGEQNLERLHELFKGLFLTTGIVKVLGKDVRIKKSTTSLSVTEFSDFVRAIENETGVQAPPTENYL